MACLFVSCKVEDTIKKLKDIMIATYYYRHPNATDWDSESKVSKSCLDISSVLAKKIYTCIWMTLTDMLLYCVPIGGRRAKETSVGVRKDGAGINMLRLQDHPPVQIRDQVYKDVKWYYRTPFKYIAFRIRTMRAKSTKPISFMIHLK